MRISKEKRNVTTQLACKRINVNDPARDLIMTLYSTEGSIISLQREGDLVPFYDSSEDSVTFEGLKLPGKKNIGVDVKACSRVDGLSIKFNGKYGEVVEEKDKDENGCITAKFRIQTETIPYDRGNLTIILKEFVKRTDNIIIIQLLLFFSHL